MGKCWRDARCHGCGASDDRSRLRVYPWPNEDHITDRPIGPSFELDVAPDDDDEQEWPPSRWKRASVCHACFHRLDPDLWISQGMWESLGPLVPFEQLPLLEV